MEITKHAFERGRKRFGFNKKALERMTKKALNEGVFYKNTVGKLHRYLTKLFFNEKIKADNIRIYGDMLFIIRGKKLITVYILPKQFRNTIKNIKANRIKKKEEKVKNKVRGLE